MRLYLLLLLCILSIPAFCQYNFYFGNIHSHSSYSDGNKDSTASGYYYPGDDYNYVKGSYHMDFLGISEHNHYNASNNPGMHVADYAKGLYQADTANKEGLFVCMYGFEWGVISGGGHVVTYGIPGLVGWESGSGAWGPANNYNIFCAKSNYANFWPIVNAYPNAFSTLAHPQQGDYNDLAGAAAYSSTADDAIAGVAIRSGSAFSTTTNYTDPAPTLYDSVYFKTLAKGYHLGPTADQDNHYTTFGRTSKIRSVVLATELKRDSIMTAYRAMRFYASDDWNAQVTFTVNGNYMGSNVVANANSSVFVSVNDPDGAADLTDTIKIYYGIPGSGNVATVLTYNTGIETLNFTQPTVAGDNYYYFAKITQADGNIIWTSPVWVSRIAVLSLELVNFSGERANKHINLQWSIANEQNTSNYEVERANDGISFTKIGSLPSRQPAAINFYKFVDVSPRNGINFYRLRALKTDGGFTYSGIVPVRFDDPAVGIISINPNPVNDRLNIVCNAKEATAVSCKMYNSEGRLVKTVSASFTPGPNTIAADVSPLPAGIYFVVLSRPNERITEAKFVKL